MLPGSKARAEGTVSRRSLRAVLPLTVLALLLVACAADANPQAGSGDAGFWLGLWHGLIAPVTFIVSLFTDDIGIYEVANTGSWYDAGFVLGLGFIVGGGSSGAARGARR